MMSVLKVRICRKMSITTKIFAQKFQELLAQIEDGVPEHLLFRGAFWTKLFTAMKHPDKQNVYSKHLPEWISTIANNELTKSVFLRKLTGLSIDVRIVDHATDDPELRST